MKDFFCDGTLSSLELLQSNDVYHWLLAQKADKKSHKLTLIYPASEKVSEQSGLLLKNYSRL